MTISHVSQATTSATWAPRFAERFVSTSSEQMRAAAQRSAEVARRPAKRARHSAPDEYVEAISDLQYGLRWVPKGKRFKRSDPLVIAHPEVFDVRYRLSEEVSEH